MRKVKSCGVLVMRATPRPSFLLMRHADRYDLPKGHIEPGECELDCALREFSEETGLTRDDVEIDPAFRHQEIYYPRYARFGGAVVEKTLVIFLGRLKHERPIVPREHAGYLWVDWNPPHAIQENTIDPLLRRVERYLASSRAG